MKTMEESGRLEMMRAVDVEVAGSELLQKVLGCQGIARCRCRGVKVKEGASGSHVRVLRN